MPRDREIDGEIDERGGDEPVPGEVEDDHTTPVLTTELDLHTFVPQECAELVSDYVTAAQDAGMERVRIIHGKGTGTLQRITHSVLARHPAVASYKLGDETSGGWGATIVMIRPKPTA